ncbi:patatin-like phospholipase family protein [Niveibacterium sp. 24ML]|uniref:patatin-like phospholipase family protein n=1 Tax=Niveibacterium sp. 24ML TaxID=2985512 RepID=UPI002271AD01|nr:patatin-like phospholipase family protein [Niveibacterium sp. 24ML]MCX9156225.1 patatin-like phospholipase family protein [Niveibacterium sp. 24ML]
MRADLMRSLSICLLAISFAATAADAPPKLPQGVGLVLGGGGARGLAHLGVIAELERLRIPISCIAGTSAGALVGGSYASGLSVEEMEREVTHADWDKLLAGVPERKDRPYVRKKDDRSNLLDVTLGLDANGLVLPRAAVSTQQIETFLRKLTRDTSVADFDTLPIPFTALATDLASGDAVEFRSGDLMIAMRSSMAVPGVFDPIRENGRLLVDGMLVRNVPVQNVKGRCADTVIVVDVGTPLTPIDEIKTLLDISAQQSNIFVRRNVSEQLARMGPGDVLIEPKLKGYSPADFALAPELIKKGREAAIANEDKLAAFSVSPAEYEAWKRALAARLAAQPSTYDVVKVEETRFVPESHVRGIVQGKQAGPMPREALLATTERLYQTGDFDRVSYAVRTEDGKRIADVMPVERAVGPNYLRFGLDFKIDSYNNAELGLLANLQMTWLNRWGAQWRNNLQLGNNQSLDTELFQPIALSPWFLSGRLTYGRDKFGIYDEDGREKGEFAIYSSTLGAGFGYSLGSLGEARLSYERSTVRGESIIGPVSPVEGQRLRLAGVHGQVVIDQLDNPRFPRNGYYLKADLSKVRARNEADVTRDATLGSFTGEIVGTLLRNTGRLTLEYAGNLTDGPQSLSPSGLGGFLKLSGYQDQEFVGARTMFGRLMVYRQLAQFVPQLGTGLYLGSSAEFGRVDRVYLEERSTGLIYAGSAFVGLDTLLGPLYLAYGQGEGGRKAGYLYLGVPY